MSTTNGSDNFGGGSEATRITAGKENRRTTRLALARPIEARLSRFIPARLVDISLDGVQVESQFRLCPRTPYQITIHFRSGLYPAWTVVRRCKVTERRLDGTDRSEIVYRAGLEFSEMPTEARSLLSSNLILLATEAPAPFGQAPPGREPSTAPRRREGPVRIRFRSRGRAFGDGG